MPSPVDQEAAPTSRPEVSQDIAIIARIEAVLSILEILCRSTGMGFAAVARVTESSWTACAVHDAIGRWPAR